MKLRLLIPAVLAAALLPAVALAQTPDPGSPTSVPPLATPAARATASLGLTVHALVPVPAGTSIDVQGFDPTTQQPFSCGIATSTVDPSGATNSSLVTIAVSSACSRSSMPLRVVINGRVATLFQFKAGADLDLGPLQLLTPEQNSSKPNPGGGAAGSLPGTGGYTARHGQTDWYLYAAVVLLAAAGVVLVSPLARRMARRR